MAAAVEVEGEGRLQDGVVDRMNLAISPPGVHKGEVGSDCRLEYIRCTVELSNFFCGT